MIKTAADQRYSKINFQLFSFVIELLSPAMNKKTNFYQPNHLIKLIDDHNEFAANSICRQTQQWRTLQKGIGEVKLLKRKLGELI